MTKPFLILQARPDKVADYEYNAFLQYGGLRADETHRVRMEEVGVPDVDLNDYAGVIVGGGPYNVSDTQDQKDGAQQHAEEGLYALLERIIDADFPYLGACYGFGALANLRGGTVSKEKYNEAVGAVTISINDAGAEDPLLHGLPRQFRAFVGHKEACQTLPEGAVLLGSSETCPIHIFRMGQNVYATQFHPELDIPGIKVRIDYYKHKGYFEPHEVDELKARAEQEIIQVPMEIMQRFVDRYRTV